jgi:hypothetical protein
LDIEAYRLCNLLLLEFFHKYVSIERFLKYISNILRFLMGCRRKNHSYTYQKRIIEENHNSKKSDLLLDTSELRNFFGDERWRVSRL